MSTTAVVKKPKAAKTASHPPYFQMIKGALLALNEKSGSSGHAIAKHMEGKHKDVLPPNFRKSLALQLKNSAAKGKLIKIKSSFKLSEAGKKDKASKKKAVKAKDVKKPALKAKTDKKKKNKNKNAKVVKTVEVANPDAPAKKVEIVKKLTKPVAKKVIKPVAKKVKPAAKKVTKPAAKKVTKPAAKKPTKKRSASMAKPRQPKSIKSPASKKAKKTPAK